LEFSFPSIVSIFLLFSMILLLANSLEIYSKKNIVVLFLIFFSIVVYIVGWRLIKNYEPYYYFQPRYLAGFIIASYGILLTTFKTKVIGNLQAILIFTSTTVSSTLSWAAVSSRYSMGQNYALTNFGDSETWLAFESLTRSKLFFIIIISSLILNYLIIRMSTKFLDH
jgi:hypothetical protein